MVKAVIFDMFETLISHYNVPQYFSQEMADDAGVSAGFFREFWHSSDTERTLGYIKFEETIEKILRKGNVWSESLMRKIVLKRKQTKQNCFDHMDKEIIPMMKALKSKGLKIALISNCFSEEAEVIHSSKLSEFFDVMNLSCEVHMKKPDSDIFEDCIKKLGIESSECLYVGDGGSNELYAAEKAGMKPLQALWYINSTEGNTSFRIEKFDHADRPLDVLKWC